MCHPLLPPKAFECKALNVVNMFVLFMSTEPLSKCRVQSARLGLSLLVLIDSTKTPERDYILKFSALEICNETVIELLNRDSGPLRLLDDPEIAESGLMNTRGSVEILYSGPNLVDLAGSERALQTKVVGIRLMEGSHINRSLLTLTTIIRKLSLESIMSQSGSSHPSDFEETDSQLGECESQPKGPKKQVRFNGSGQPVGPGSAQYVSFIGVLLKTNIAWKGWKYRLRKVYDAYSTNAERIENIPKRIKKEDWERFIEICSMDEEQIKREKGKSSRENMRLPHTSGRHGCARIEDDLDEIKRLVSLDPFLGNKDLDNDPVAKAVVHAAAPYNRIIEEEKRKCETTDGNFRLVMQRLDEESRARKILEEKLEVYARDPPEFENISQARCRSPVVDEESDVMPFGRCLLKNFKRKSVALGSVSSDFTSADSYSITVDDIFDYTTELYIGERTLGDVSICNTIKWSKTFVEPI
ncbi:hypothetical protein IFM89_016059 [Coptis chinensis]|uniref:Kinesin motor domain-containing protein n=1 Tax=Coptis chinensis TaxID=261450 RepID=A0A835HLE9_9MAGN|nr:hypothetical protein IFM89_016059 [Coptis chinensis]